MSCPSNSHAQARIYVLGSGSLSVTELRLKSPEKERKKENKVMKKGIAFAAVLGMASVGMTSVAWAAGSNREATEDRLQHAGAVLHEVMAAPDKGIPEEVLDHAKCIAVVPHLLKGGFVFGAENGRGVATCRTADGWSAPAFFAITGGSWGLQIGVEGIDLVMVIQGDKGMDDLINSKFEIGGDVSAAAGPVGRHASADTDWKMNTEILTYSRAKGVFAGITLNGAGIRRDDDSTEAIYGHEVSTRRILTGEVPPPPGTNAFLDAVRDAKMQAKASR
jgi:lipid-binding SYLF domain-containing protein